MLNTISNFITAHSLLRLDGRYLVALSGGADSVAMLLVLKELGYQLEAVHCNFHLRDKESDRDEAFCVSLCKRMSIPLHLAHFDTRFYASLHHVSIEMAARDLRYSYFEKLRKDMRMDGICVAHHSDDNVETIMLNLVRGTGVHGLTGMSPQNGFVLRPLLCVSRCEIEHFLKVNGQDFVTDSSNLVADVERNKIRLDILPQLKLINPAFHETLLRMAGHLTEAEKILNALAEPLALQMRNEDSVALSDILASASPQYLLYQLLSPYGFSSAQVSQMLAKQHVSTGKIWRTETHELLFNRGKIIIQPCDDNTSKSLKIPEQGTYIYDENIKLSVKESLLEKDFTIPREKNTIALDFKDIIYPLILRRVQLGDRFVPFGMNGTKLVSDYLTDIKKNLFEKRRQLVLLNGNGDIIWLVGERPDNRYRVTTETTRVLTVTV